MICVNLQNRDTKLVDMSGRKSYYGKVQLDRDRPVDTVGKLCCESPHDQLRRSCHSDGRMTIAKSTTKVNIFAVTRVYFMVELGVSLGAHSKSGVYVSWEVVVHID